MHIAQIISGYRKQKPAG